MTKPLDLALPVAADDVDWLDDATAQVDVSRFAAGVAMTHQDAVAAEEPLEIRIGGVSLAILMRTPGHDRELALGFLRTEHVVADLADLTSIRHCTIARDPESVGNVLQVRLREGVEVDLDRLRRNLVANASCGICGKATISGALRMAPPVHDLLRLKAEQVLPLAGRLRRAQRVFDRTGGLHAAGLFSEDGRLLVAREDIGRHNAVDKVIGWAMGEGRLPLAGHLLVVSGRISCEIVQKALVARIPVLVALSAPSSLAVRLADQAGMTLIAFLRGDAFNVYSGRERLVP